MILEGKLPFEFRLYIFGAKLMERVNEQESPLDGTQKNWTQLVHVKTAHDLITGRNDKRSIVFQAHQEKFGSLAQRRSSQEPQPET